MLQGKIAAEEEVDVLNEEIIVFEIPDQQDIEQHTQNETQLHKPLLPAVLYGPGQGVVHQDGGGDQQQIAYIEIPIEKQGSGDQKQVLRPAKPLAGDCPGQQIITQQHQRQKGKNKNMGGKDHDYSLSKR